MSLEETFTHNTYEEGYDFFIKDKWNKTYHFKVSTFAVPSGLLSEAIEVTDGDNEREPRKYTILSDFEADVEESELMLKAKIKKDINRRHLVYEHGKPMISEEGVLRGRLGGIDNYSDSQFETCLIIDGQKITIERFVEMLGIYSDYNFKFQIIDPGDDID